jgi:hypothetical protein
MGVVEQLPALGGVIVGAALSFVSGGLAARAQWQRTLSVRWDSARLAAYVEFLGEAKAIAMISLRLGATRGFRPDREPENVVPLGLEEGYALLADADARRSTKIEPILLLSDTPTIASAQALNDILRRMGAVARDDNAALGVWRATRIEYLRARADFYVHARRDLGAARAQIALSSAYAVDPVDQPGAP